MLSKKYILIVFVLAAISISGCKKFLDIVPDKTQEIELLFERKEAAYIALATCYHYLPQQDGVYSTHSFASDELTTPIQQETPGVELMRGLQTKSEPLLSWWAGYYAHGKSQESLWRALRDCNIFIENIDLVPNMTDEEKAEWKAEVIFLKAYYHFLLLTQYGPIPIVDVNLPITADPGEFMVPREPVDEVFDYIVNTINLAMNDLPERITSENDFGRVDKIIAAAIKSRVLLFAASPLYNGNSEFYGGFSGPNGNDLFNPTYDNEKWKLALDAAVEAIDLAESNGHYLYEYTDFAPNYDSIDYDFDEVKGLYNYRYMFTDKWNSELIWGHSNPVQNADWWKLQAAAMMMYPDQANEAAWQWVSPTMEIVETYYTENGLPIDEDLTFNYDFRYGLTLIPDDQSLHAQPGEVTVMLHLNREPRFYASIAFDRGINRTWGEKWNLQMRKDEPHGRIALTNDYVITGYALKKICHPSSEADAYNKLIDYPWPIIRLAELYLNFAEAYNEYYGPSQEVYDALNLIRERSYVPKIEDAWSDPELALNPGKHTSQNGLQEIIRQERMIELAFEGHRYYDLRRWKIAHEYFDKPVQGWSVNESSVNGFYSLIDVGQRSFITPRDYMFPIPEEEIIINTNLVQSPGW